MKKIVNISLSGRGFSMDEDAYRTLKGYLDTFRGKVANEAHWKEVMDDIERRISELFTEKLSCSYKDVVNISMVNEVIIQLGLPDGSEYPFGETDEGRKESYTDTQQWVNPKKSLYRNTNEGKIGGVCSGLAIYLNVDVAVLRVVFLLLLIFGTSGFWIYVIFWIVVPNAVTPLEMCRMYGLPVTAENLSKFAGKKQ